jgi:2-keto-3-deoxy-L-fuconate dehydrogenase
MFRLDGKTCIITAAGQGMGRAIALACAEAGADVLATSTSESSLSSLAAAYPAIRTQRLDVLDASAITAFAEATEKADVLFNCAGVVHNGTILDSSEADWDLAFDLNVRSMYRMTKALLPKMIAAGGGTVINIASVAGGLKGVPNRFVYGCTKAAVIGFTKGLAIDFITQGIRSNAICPGTIDTPSLTERVQARPDPAKARADFIARQPIGRLGRPEEIAALAVYLASDDAAFTTGAVHVIDGGFTL